MNNIFELKIRDIIAVQVFLQKRKSRIYVGSLTYKGKDEKPHFHFEYDPPYLKNKSAIPLGPELPLTEQYYRSSILFPPFQDRIPSKENPAYPDYCEMMGISKEEQDPIILLCTIGRKGPSSFIFEPLLKEDFSSEKLKQYREELGLTIREFAALFDISFSHLQRIETKKFSGKEILRRIEIYQKFPEIALYEILRRGGVLHADKKRKLINILKERITSSFPLSQI